jgi:thiamine transport system permease protein
MLTLPPRPARIGVASLLAIAIAGLIVAVLWAILDAATEPSGASRVDIPHLWRA